MKIFATVHTPVEQGTDNLKLGRLVANLGFFHALLTYGTYDQYQLFLPTVQNIKDVKKYLNEHIGDPALLSRITLSHHLNLIDALKSTNFTVFHTPGWYRYLPGLAFVRSRRAKYPFPITGVIHSLHNRGMVKECRNLMAAPLAPYDSIVCTSEAGKEVFRRYIELGSAPRDAAQAFPARLDRIPLGVSEDLLIPSDKSGARKRLGIEPDCVMALFFGRISPVTKADLVPLVRVISRLSQRHDKLVLVIGGGATEKQCAWLEQLITYADCAKHIKFRPNVDDTVRADLLAAADFFVSPVDNIQETFGISVVEAMAFGLPVIASDFNGYRELVDHGVTGFKVPTTWAPLPDLHYELSPLVEESIAQMLTAQTIALDISSLMDQIEILITNPVLRQTMGNAGRKKVKETYTWRKIVARYETLWGELKADADSVGLMSCHGHYPGATDLFSVFSHYVTRTLQPETIVVLGPFFHANADGTVSVPQSSEELEPVAHQELVTQLIDQVRLSSTTVASLVASAKDSLNVDESVTHFHILRLIKLGFLAVQS